jgi:hypothetical protein
MKNGRTMFWIVFLGTAALLAAIPEFMTSQEPAVAAISRPAPLASLRPAAPAASTPATPDTTTPVVLAKNDLFAAKSWHVPPPPPPPPPSPPPSPAPAPPAAPPLPFKYIGKLDDASSLKAFLQRNEKVFAVSVGDVIEGAYRIDAINPGQMTLIYLPLNIPQTLSAGSPL